MTFYDNVYGPLTWAVEEKYGRTRANDESSGDAASDSSTDTEEDDEGILVSGVLDAQIQDTLEAIKRKDPRVYDAQAKFYTNPDKEHEATEDSLVRKEKPMYLSDYHRKNLLEGDRSSADLPSDGPKTYVQQQNNLKDDLIKEMHAATALDDDRGNHSNGDDEFLIRKTVKLNEGDKLKGLQQKARPPKVESAEEDPEGYLSQFMQARAWVPTEGSRFQPFESDDEDEERQAELFEEAYNLRFEDSSASNEKLMSHARDAAAKYSVRKEAINPRKRVRELERAKKDAEKRLREEEKIRLRKLKVAEAEEKIQQIREAAGLRGESLDDQDWAALIEEGWDDVRWDEEMKKRFGDDYYKDRDEESKGRKGIKKPKWVNDIEIDDLVPDFEVEDKHQPQSSFTEKASRGKEHDSDLAENSVSQSTMKRRGNKKREKDEQKRSARQERQKIERIVDQRMEVDETLSSFSKKHAGNFRYRETSPAAFGLTASDILTASDSQLNQYAGLKKLATFRDAERKRKDKKHLGKKARLRQWRKETFGDIEEPTKTFTDLIAKQNSENIDSTKSRGDVVDGKRRKKRQKPGK